MPFGLSIRYARQPRSGAVWKLARLITLRPSVQIRPPPPRDLGQCTTFELASSTQIGPFWPDFARSRAYRAAVAPARARWLADWLWTRATRQTAQRPSASSAGRRVAMWAAAVVWVSRGGRRLSGMQLSRRAGRVGGSWGGSCWLRGVRVCWLAVLVRSGGCV